MAMIDLGKLGFGLVLDKDGWKEDWEQANQDVEQHEGKWNKLAGNMSGKLKTACVAGIVGITAAIGGMAVAGVNSAIQLEDSMAKFSSATGVVGEEAEEVKETIKDLYKVNEDSYEDIAKTTEALSNNLQMNSDEIKTYAQNYMDYAKVTGQANEQAVKEVGEIRNAWGLANEEMPQIMDKLKYSQEQYGLSVTESQKALKNLAPAMKGLGMNVDDAIGYLNMFKANGVSSTAATTAFSYALKKVDSPEQLKQLIEDIQNTKDATERSKKAVELFGAKAGVEMANALQPGTEAMEAFKVSAEEASGTVSKASGEYDKSFKTQLALAKKQFLGLVEALGESLLPTLNIVLEWVNKYVPVIVDFASKAIEDIKFLIEPFINIIKDVMSVFDDLLQNTDTNFNGIKETIMDVLNSIKDFIGVVVAIMEQIWNDYGETIQQYLELVWDNLKAIFENGIKIIQGIFELFTAILTGDWEKASEAINKIVSAMWDTIKTVFSNAIKAVKLVFSNAVSIFKDIATALMQGIWTAFKAVWNSITGWFSNVFNSLFSWFGNLGSSFANAGKNMLNSVLDGLKDKWTSVKRWVSDKVSWLTDKLAFWRRGQRELNSDDSDSGSRADGSHKLGLPRVPYDGYKAILHEDEMVLDKYDADDYRSGMGGQVVHNYEGMFNGANFSIKTDNQARILARQLTRDISDVQNKNMRGWGLA